MRGLLRPFKGSEVSSPGTYKVSANCTAVRICSSAAAKANWSEVANLLCPANVPVEVAIAPNETITFTGAATVSVAECTG